MPPSPPTGEPPSEMPLLLVVSVVPAPPLATPVEVDGCVVPLLTAPPAPAGKVVLVFPFEEQATPAVAGNASARRASGRSVVRLMAEREPSGNRLTK